MEAYTEIFVWGSNKQGQLGLGPHRKEKTSPAPLACSYSIRIRHLACGQAHTVFVAFNGLTYAMGCNEFGQLGIGPAKQVPSPSLVEGLAHCKVFSVACGHAHTAAIAESGKAYAWGDGSQGALGNGGLETSWRPTSVNLPARAVDVACGGRHSVFLIDSLTENVLVCGAGDVGQLGTGRRDREVSPVAIPINGVKQVAAGEAHTLFVTTMGTVYACGNNTSGQLGTGSHQSEVSPVRLTALEGRFVEKVACGGHSGCLTNTGDLFVWGTTTLGTFLTPHLMEISRIRKLAIGSHSGVAIAMNGMIYAWGHNASGELGQCHTYKKSGVVEIGGLASKKVTEVVVGGGFCIALGEDIYDKHAIPPATRSPRIQTLEFENAKLRSAMHENEVTYQL